MLKDASPYFSYVNIMMWESVKRYKNAITEGNSSRLVLYNRLLLFTQLHYSWSLQINEVSATTYNLSLRFVHDEAVYVPGVQSSVTERRHFIDRLYSSV